MAPSAATVIRSAAAVIRGCRREFHHLQHFNHLPEVLMASMKFVHAAIHDPFHQASINGIHQSIYMWTCGMFLLDRCCLSSCIPIL
ncbi:unnamed protein product [Urochloa humidicola]